MHANYTDVKTIRKTDPHIEFILQDLSKFCKKCDKIENFVSVSVVHRFILFLNRNIYFTEVYNSQKVPNRFPFHICIII